MDDGGTGLYIHVPFCERVCPYCDFAVVAARRLSRAAEDEYLGALLRELELRRGAFHGRPLASLYLGGGTPSLLRPDSVARLIEAARSAFPRSGPTPGPISDTIEITLEVNPSTLERERLPGFRAAGVNRLSLGVQSFDDALLKRLGRAHRAEEARRSLRAARAAGFERLSIDLIFSVPGQPRGGLDRDLTEALGFEPEHLSTYELTVEPGTPYATAAARGQLPPPPETDTAWMFERIRERLKAAGYRSYELSNHARPGFEAVHNARYWDRRPVLGLGTGAWSLDPASEASPHGVRRGNVRDLPTYLARIREGRPPAAEPPDALDAATARGEAVFLALRTERGLDAGRFAAEFGAPPRAFFAAQIDALASAGLIEEDRDNLRLTPSGRILSDSVFEHFV